MLPALLFMVLCFLAARRIIGPGWTANMQVWFLFLFFVMDFVGLHILWLIDREPVNPLLIGILYLLPACLLAADLVLQPSGPLRAQPSAPPADLPPGTGPLLLVLGGLSLVFLALYIKYVPRVPLLVALSGAGEVGEARTESTLWQAGTAFKYAWLVVVRYLLPLVAITAFVRCRLTRRFTHRAAAGFLLLVTYVALMIDAQKAQVIFFSVQLLVASLLLKHRLRLPATSRARGGGAWRFVFGIVLLLLGFEGLALMYFSFMAHSHSPGEGFWQANQFITQAIFRRTFISQARPIMVIFNQFPDHHAYLMGRTFPFAELAGLGMRFDISQFAFEQIYGLPFGGASTLFVSEFYADFGPWAALASILLFAGVFIVLERRLRSRLGRPEGIIIYAFLTGHVMRLAITQVIMGLALPLIGCFLFRQGRKLARRLAAGRPGPAHAGPGLDGG